MSRFLKWTAVAMFALAATGCATITVSSHVERGWNFTPYRTFAWGPADALPTGDPRLDKDPFFQDHVEGAVERQMQLIGFEPGETETADLLIHYHANISTRINVTQADANYGYCYGEDCNARVVEYEAGTLVLDVVDAKTSRVIWRGWAQGTVEDALKNRDRMAKKIDESVERMLATFPKGITTAAAVPTGGFASTDTDSFLAPGTDFHTYREYTWAAAGQLLTGDPRLDNNPFFLERIQSAVEKQLAARGFEKAADGKAVMTIHYHAGVEQRVDGGTADPAYNENCNGCGPFVYDEGTLVLDFVDTQTGQLIWRGWAESSIDGKVDRQDRMESMVDKAVTRILGKLPAGL